MEPDSDGAPRDLLSHVLLPVAHEEDALATARSLEPYDPRKVTALHVVEKAGGAPDKTPIEQSEQVAADAYDAVRTVFPDADDHTTYGRDVVDEIFDSAAEVGATVVAYRSRGGTRLVRFLAGDYSARLASDAPYPVLVLPERGADQ